MFRDFKVIETPQVGDGDWASGNVGAQVHLLGYTNEADGWKLIADNITFDRLEAAIAEFKAKVSQ